MCEILNNPWVKCTILRNTLMTHLIGLGRAFIKTTGRDRSGLSSAAKNRALNLKGPLHYTHRWAKTRCTIGIFLSHTEKYKFNAEFCNAALTHSVAARLTAVLSKYEHICLLASGILQKLARTFQIHRTFEKHIFVFLEIICKRKYA